MKFSVYFKTPDTQQEALEDLRDDLTHLDNREAIDEQAYRANALMSKFIRHGEYVRIQFDTNTGTAIVMPLLPNKD